MKLKFVEKCHFKKIEKSFFRFSTNMRLGIKCLTKTGTLTYLALPHINTVKNYSKCLLKIKPEFDKRL